MTGSFEYFLESATKQFNREVSGIARLMMVRDRPGEVWHPNVRKVYEQIAAKSLIERYLQTYSNKDGVISIPEAAANIRV